MTDRNIYVACLAAYNAGRLHGEWFALDEYDDAADLREAIEVMMKASPAPFAEEYAIHDHEGFEPFTVGEFTSLSEVWAYHEWLTEAADEWGDDAADTLAALADHVGDEYLRKGLESDGLDWVRDRYLGCYSEPGDYAHEMLADTVPEHLRFYVDWKAIERDMGPNGEAYISERGGQVYVFATH